MRSVRYVYSLQAMSMGFAFESFKEALKRCHGDVEKAINMLVSNNGVLPVVSQLNKGKSYLT